MGSLGLKRDRRFKQGIFKPENPSKVIGNNPIIYRSSIERKFCKFCDTNPNVLKWSSEEIVIPYYDTVSKKNRKYYVDNFVMIKEKDTVKKYLIELKDIKETREPVKKRGKRKTTLLYEQMTYQTNLCKWKKAVEFCKNHNLEFLLIGYSKKNGFEQVKLIL